MIHSGLAHFADALVFAHGKRAPAEAAMHAILAEKSGDTEMAELWRTLQGHLKGSAPEECRKAA
jgi:hypothetical protein